MDVSIYIHSLHHIYITNRPSLGHPIRRVSREVGYSSIEITVDVQSDWVPDRTEEIMNNLDRIGRSRLQDFFSPSPNRNPSAPSEKEKPATK